MKIENNILKSYLKNVLFITGTAYAGKSTMCAMLAEKFDLFHCGENYKLDEFLETLIRTSNLIFVISERTGRNS
jgi:adenylylsulfate kinase-like enzyme